MATLQFGNECMLYCLHNTDVVTVDTFVGIHEDMFPTCEQDAKFLLAQWIKAGKPAEMYHWPNNNYVDDVHPIVDAFFQHDNNEIDELQAEWNKIWADDDGPTINHKETWLIDDLPF